MDDLQLVVFGYDGVLVDCEVISNEVLARALSERGLPRPLVQDLLQCSESLDHLVAVGAVCPEHPIEVLAIDVHNGHQHVGRSNPGGTSPTGYVEGVLGDLCDRVAIVDTDGSGSRAIGALALYLEGSFAYAERL